MAFCTSTDVLAEFKALSWNSSTVSSSDVSEFITQEENYVKAKVGKVYDIENMNSTDNPQSWSILKKISIMLVASRVKDILITRTGNSQTDQTSEPKKSLADQAKMMLKEIVEGDLPLPDGTLLSSTGGVSSYTVDLDECDQHKFKRDCVQW